MRSRTGTFKYSTADGIETAKLARARGAAVVFYSEWGLKDVPGHGRRIEEIYREMATAADARVAPVGRAWDLALAARPEFPLFSSDGNHQSAVGAFLTACVLFGRLTNESPGALADFPYEMAGDGDRRFLAETAANALAQPVAVGAKQ